jgi:hypothetical protein
MLSADKIREITKRARHNIYDEQLRILNEEILESAKTGKYSFTVSSETCVDQGFDYCFWFDGAKNDSSEWRKINLIMLQLGYTISFEIKTFDSMKITVFW